MMTGNWVPPDRLNLSWLQQLQQKPAPFTAGDPLFWDDPHISQQMLAVHLDPTVEAASRSFATIDRSVAWLCDSLNLNPGDSVLDLGCGPGLYASRLARHGMQVTGIDYSRRSIDYAVQQAAGQNLEISYRYQNYLDLGDVAQYDAALLIYGDFCPLSPEQRARLLQNVWRALRPGGYFVLDVSTRAHRQQYGTKNRWSVEENGFWNAGTCLVLEQGFDYPDELIYLDQYIVIDAGHKVRVFRNWFQDYTAASITAELEAGGFAIQSLWADLAGTPFSETGEWIGVISRRAKRRRPQP